MKDILGTSDTIAAVATAYGEGGIGIIRISGEKAERILSEIFVPAHGRQFENRKLTYGHVMENEKIIDEAMAVLMKAPYTYTREDVVEINCHGSIIALRRTLELALDKGARLAEPGEFTKRAFLNGRLDLSQAEAVMDLISAKTDRIFDISINQLEGSFSKEISEIRKKLLDLLVDITVNIDYPDEDIEELTYEKLISGIEGVRNDIENILSTSDTGRILKEGLKVTIAGKPNVGKSSLMNAILKESRAIVTDIPGTTRDTIEESVSIKNIPVVLTDTAGIRSTSDEIEKIGIEKSKESFNSADLIILILDGSRKLEKEDKELIEITGDRKCIVLLNKTDLGKVLKRNEISEILTNAEIIETSLKENNSNQAVSDLEDKISEMFLSGNVYQSESSVVTNVRHKDILKRGLSLLSDSLDMAGMHEALEFIEVDVNEVYSILGEITGESINDDIINEVFSRFCLGK